jgi:hypothetical protein
MKLSVRLRGVLLHAPELYERECSSLNEAISIIEKYETIPDGYIQCIYDPEEYMLVARVK